MQHLDSLLAHNFILIACSGGNFGCNGHRGSTNTGVRIVIYAIGGSTDGSNESGGSYEPSGAWFVAGEVGFGEFMETSRSDAVEFKFIGG